MTGYRSKYVETSADKFWNQFIHLEDQLAKGKIKIARVPGSFMTRTYCMDCDEPCNAILVKGERLLIVINGDRFLLHQCPPPVDPREGDDETADDSENPRSSL